MTSATHRNKYAAQGTYLTSHLLSREFRARGCETRRIGDVLVVALADKTCFLLETETSFTSVLAFRVLKNKELAKAVFQDAGLNVAEGHLFMKHERTAAFEKLRQLAPAVVKPVDGNKGRGVSVNVGPESFEAAWSAAAPLTQEGIIVERYFQNGQEARYLVVDGTCVAVHKRIPPSVQGDGVSTIAQLVQQQNEVKLSANPSRTRCLIKIDSRRIQILRSQGQSLDSIPAKGQSVVIDWKAGLSTGADAQDITAEVHQSMKRVAERIAEVVPGSDVLGVDILAKDHSQAASPDNYIIVEANTRPMILGHQFPDFGKPINVCRLIAESCLRRMEVGPTAAGGLPSKSGRRARQAALSKRQQAPAPPPGTVLVTSASERQRAGSQAEPDELRLVFGGDTSLGDAYLHKASASAQLGRLESNPLSFFEELLPLVADKSWLVLNLETVLCEWPQGPLDGIKGYLGWDTPDRTVGLLTQIGVDAVSLANNHSMDFGPDRLLQTIARLEKAGIKAFGAGSNIAEAGRPLQLITAHGNIYVLGGFEFRRRYDQQFKFYAGDRKPGVRPFAKARTNRIAESIAAIRKQDPDSFVVAYPHWGGAANYRWAGEDMQEASQSFHEAGADLVIGHGSHMVQQVRSDSFGTTVFSLGNFVFNSPGRYRKPGALPYSLVCRLQLERGEGHWTAGLQLYPILSDNRSTGYRPRPSQEPEARALYERLAEKGGSPFRDSFALDRDSLGWHLLLTGPLSPRVRSRR